MGVSWRWTLLLLLLVSAFCIPPAWGLTNNMDILNAIFGDISNAGTIGWPQADPCGSPRWDKVQCSSTGDVTALFLKNFGLTGTLNPQIAKLPGFTRLDAQNNFFTGALPSFAGVATLTTLYLSNNNFTSIPADFFDGLTGLQIVSLDENPGLAAWSLPPGLAASVSLQAMTMPKCNVQGTLPDFLGTFTQLNTLNLGSNNLSGGIPDTFAGLTQLATLKLNNQAGSGLSGGIGVVGSLAGLTTLWLHYNSFNGTIPAALGSVLGLVDVELNNNQLVGVIPGSFAGLTALTTFDVQNNDLVGPIPSFPASTVATLSGNNFCQSSAGVACAPDVSSLLDFLAGVGYSSALTGWGGPAPCSYSGVVCSGTTVARILLPSRNLVGSISASLGNLTGLLSLNLSSNFLQGTIPDTLSALPSIQTVDLSNNNLSPPVPKFASGVVLLVSGNPLIDGSAPRPAPATPAPPGAVSPPGSPPVTPTTTTSPPLPPPPVSTNASSGVSPRPPKSSSVSVGLIAGVVVGSIAVLLVSGLCGYFVYRRKRVGAWRLQSPNNLDGNRHSDEGVKVVVENGSPSQLERLHSGPSGMQVEPGSFVIPMQLLQRVTDNFNDRNILGRGGFGVVYMGELDDGTKIAVKRMESAAVSNKGMQEFQAEIEVLTKVRHRHLVGLLGYCMEGNEKLLVYEFMPEGTLSQHLFEYARYDCQPLTWKQRLVIALDVARGIEYLHGLAHKSFIHRDLKPSNILLGDDLRAKVSDFGLVKLAPEGKYSVETRLAGTFGYLAPEYAVTGRVTTKADVFSFGVILMELLTGRRALDDTQSEENVHLVTWFKRMNLNKEALINAVDSTIEITDETTVHSITTVAELAGHCTAREPYQRPDMGHAVNVLAPLVERWKPTSFDADDTAGIDLELTLPQALKRWQSQNYENGSMSDMDRTEIAESSEHKSSRNSRKYGGKKYEKMTPSLDDLS